MNYNYMNWVLVCMLESKSSNLIFIFIFWTTGMSPLHYKDGTLTNPKLGNGARHPTKGLSADFLC